MATSNQPPQYRLFLLTAWGERGQERGSIAAWRFGLEEVQDDGHKRHFVSFDDMMLYLKQEIEADAAEKFKGADE